MEELGLPPQAARPDLCSLGEDPLRGIFVPGDENIPRIFSFRDGGEMESIREFGWNILDAVDGKVNPFLEEGLLDLFHEEPFSADLRQGGILYFIPCGFDLDQGDLEIRMGL